MKIFTRSKRSSAQTQEQPCQSEAAVIWIVIGLSDQLTQDLISQFYPLDTLLHDGLNHAGHWIIFTLIPQTLCNVLKRQNILIQKKKQISVILV